MTNWDRGNLAFVFRALELLKAMCWQDSLAVIHMLPILSMQMMSIGSRI